MQRFLFSILVAALSALTSAGAQAVRPAAPSQPTVKVSTDIQWEYLVISFGKTYFSSAADIAAKQSGQSKLMIFGPLGGVVASEALDVQSQVDVLGRYGWELIAVLGAIGGDQEWVFKRTLNPARKAAEEAQIKKEGAALAKPPAAILIDLDEQDAKAKKSAEEQALRTNIKERLSLNQWPIATINMEALNRYSDRSVDVVLDVTQRALSGNSYRSSAVNALVKEYVAALRNQGRNVIDRDFRDCPTDTISLNIGASIKFSGQFKQAIPMYLSNSYCLKM